MELVEALDASPGQGLEGKGFAVQLEEHVRILPEDNIRPFPYTGTIIKPAVITYEVRADTNEAIVYNISLHLEIVMNTSLQLGTLLRGYCTRNLVYYKEPSRPIIKVIRARHRFRPYHSVRIGIEITCIVDRDSDTVIRCLLSRIDLIDNDLPNVGIEL